MRECLAGLTLDGWEEATGKPLLPKRGLLRPRKLRMGGKYSVIDSVQGGE
jgi:hypothetical protein